MSLTLPSELTWALSMIGIDFPDADEDKLNEMGQAWLTFANQLRGFIDEADKHATAVWTVNSGEAVAAVQRSWTGSEAPLTNLREGAEAAAMIAAGLATAATIVVWLKRAVIAEIAAFAYSVGVAAAASSTGIGAIIGAGIVIARRIIAQQAIDAAIELTIERLLNG
jgi:hypothetical protein